MKTKTSNSPGFTLLEILLVVGIIAILAGIVIIAINPGRQLATVRNTQREFNLNEINKALTQYYIDYSSYPATTPTSLTEICATGASSSPAAGFDCTGLINLSALVPVYLVAIPTDPSGASSTLTFLDNLIPKAYALTNGTGYKIIKNANNKIGLSAPLAEQGTVVTVGSVPTTVAFSATGGTITYTDSSGLNPRSSPAYAGGYTVHTFLLADSGTNFTVTGSKNVDVLVVAGGGGGGSYSGGAGGGGGGGAGGYQYNASFSVSSSVTVTVGEGGARGVYSGGVGHTGTNGNNSVFDTITSNGGGGGGSYNYTTPAGGGSGGGGVAFGDGVSGASGTTDQGNNGGNGNDNGDDSYAGGGGGGSGAVGANGNNVNYYGGNGGAGTSNSISGTSVCYAGGGAGGVAGAGGSGAGSATCGGGGGSGNPAPSGTANRGGGGSGGSWGSNGGNGGSGVVIVRYASI